MKRTTLTAALAVLTLISCSKEEKSTTQQPLGEVTSFNDIKVPAGFDFAGTRTITVSLPPQQNASANSRSLIQIMDANDNVLLKYNAILSQGFQLPLEVTGITEDLFYIATDGSKRSVKISNNQLILK
tara:strand:+ start:233 stop:616 length:384 start_codon:yes stop_codon:yes gene_type:complete